MGWVKIDDQWPRNPKARAVGKDGRELFIAGLCYCASYLTDGFIPVDMVDVLAGEAQVKPAVAQRLVEQRLWTPTEGGFEVHKYLAYNRSREEVLAERQRNKERQQSHRASRRDRPRDNGRSNGVSVDAPSRPRDVLTSSSDLTGDRARPDDDVLAAACKRLAETEADHHDDIGNRPAWVRSRAATLRREHEPEAARVLAQHPDLDAHTLARYLAGEHAAIDPDRRWLPGTGWVQAV